MIRLLQVHVSIRDVDGMTDTGVAVSHAVVLTACLDYIKRDFYDVRAGE